VVVDVFPRSRNSVLVGRAQHQFVLFVCSMLRLKCVGRALSGYDGSVEVSASIEATLNFEAVTPAEIVSGSGVVAAPTYNAWQMDLTVLKISGDVAFAVHPGSIALVTGAIW
jgi:hypothetical protein